MAWRQFGEVFESDNTDKAVYQPFSTANDTVLRAIRTWFIVQDDASYTSITMHLYADDGTNTPGGLIQSADNVFLKADFQTETNAANEIWFSFQPNDIEGIALKANTTYHLVPEITGYAGISGDKLVAWRRGWPDSIYNRDITFKQLAVAPYEISFIGADL